MSDPITARRSRRTTGAFLALCALLMPACAVAAGNCSDLARQLKLDALDQMWGAVLEDADKLLDCDSNGPSAPQGRFYRARALDRLRKRTEAFEAYGSFLERDCRRDGSEFLCKDARVARVSLLRELVEKEGTSAQWMKQLVGELKNPDIYTRIFTAIQISKLPGSDAAKSQALPVLVEAYRLEDDPDFRNEICLAIIQIDPTKCGQGTATRGPDDEPSFIKARVFDCNTNKVKVSVNMPFSFAKAVFESLGPEILSQIKEEGFDVENLWESLRAMDNKQKFQLKIDDDDRCEEIEVWFE